MKMQSIKRTLALILALVMLLALSACSGIKPSGGENPGPTAPDGKVFDASTEISIVVGSHPTWPFDENWPSWKYFREATGATLKITAIPNTDMSTKLPLMMADKSALPDLIYLEDKLSVDTYAASGALIAIDDYLDQMPNYTKFWDSLPKEERDMRLIRRRSADGKTYYPQNYGTDSRQNIRSWLYRKDIFEKHNLAIPETMDDVYKVCKELKKLYPQSYPFCMRQGLSNMNVFAVEWKPNFAMGLYYDFANKKWSYGAVEPTMREIVEFLRKMYADGLMPTDYLTINTKTWEELMSTDRGFILQDYVVRVDNFNVPNRKQNPTYTLCAMKPPRAGSATAQSLVSKFNVDPKGYIICNTGDKKRIKNALKLIDWMYSDQAAQLMGWGKEGETFEVKDGKKQYIRPKDGDIEGKYGLFSYGTYLRVDPDAAVSVASEEQQKSVALALEYTEKDYNPANWLAFSNDDVKQRDSLYEAVTTYSQEMLSKFLYMQEPMSNWDSFVKQLQDLGVNDLVAMYDKTYTEVTK